MFGRSSEISGFSVATSIGLALAGCYNAPVGTMAYLTNAQRVIARIFSNGAVDTSLALVDVPAGTVFGSVASPDGASAFWVSSASYSQTLPGAPSPSPVAIGAGVRYWSCAGGGGCQSSPPSVPVFDAYPINSISIGEPQNGGVMQRVG
jgi:hypothetical protein